MLLNSFVYNFSARRCCLHAVCWTESEPEPQTVPEPEFRPELNLYRCPGNMPEPEPNKIISVTSLEQAVQRVTVLQSAKNTTCNRFWPFFYSLSVYLLIWFIFHKNVFIFIRNCLWNLMQFHLVKWRTKISPLEISAYRQQNYSTVSAKIFST